MTGKESLYDFEEAHPELVPLIHTLLRGYEGIFDQPVTVRERQLAWNAHMEPAQVTAELGRLQAFGIIDHIPAKESPQVYFLRERPAAEDLYINPVSYRQRKEQYSTRIRAMQRYSGLVEECRSRFLANYFGDKEVSDCGICDNCLRRKPAATPNPATRPRR